MAKLNRRSFVANTCAAALAAFETRIAGGANAAKPAKGYKPGRIVNEYSRFLPGEETALAASPTVARLSPNSVQVSLASETKVLTLGQSIEGWQLMAIADMNGTATAVFEKHVTHRGAIVYVTEREGVIDRIPKGIGDLSNIRPRPTDTPHGVKLKREATYEPGPDVAGNYILNSSDDPCYENVAALGAEYIGWGFIGNEQMGPLGSLFLEADGKSRQINKEPAGQGLWAPDLAGSAFDPSRFFPGEPHIYQYKHGFSKRTMLGGYLPVADIGVWNDEFKAGYEVMVLLPTGKEAKPLGRVRIATPNKNGYSYSEHYWNTDAPGFFAELAGIWNYWHHFYEDRLNVQIPDPWLLDAARAGITLSRCSYRGVEPTYQIGEGAYTKIPERSHALFPVAHYEFVWAHQLWNLTSEAEPYVRHYLGRYILPDGNFLYNTQDQVEGPLNTGVFLANSARAYDYTHNLKDLESRLPVLRRMIEYVLNCYDYSKTAFSESDRRYGLIWGSPEADLGDPRNDFPESHPYYYQNAAWIWRGLREHARCLARAAQEKNQPALADESKQIAATAEEMRANIERSLKATIAAADPEMRNSGITPFSPDDTHHKPTELSSYENHRFMMDWFTADWGDPSLDLGHLKHREMAGEQIAGLHTDGDSYRTSNFMEHGTLAVKIRQADYRPFLLTLYSLVCYAADSGSRYSPEDAYIPGSYPGEGSPYGWSAVVNSVLQPTLGLRWLLCYEENDRDVCHLQKAAPKHWFTPGESIKVEKCPTRFGVVSWSTESKNAAWNVTLDLAADFLGDVALHVHRPDGRPLSRTAAGAIEGNSIRLPRAFLAGKRTLRFSVE
jgi:hypothetical protein